MAPDASSSSGLTDFVRHRADVQSFAPRRSRTTVVAALVRMRIGALAAIIALSCADERPAPISLTPYVSAGAGYTCVIAQELQCWGENGHGLADPPEELRDVWSVSLGKSHACALPDYKPVCWGLNNYGQTDVPQGTPIRAVSVGAQHTCAIRDSGELVCWGSNRYGQTDPPPGRFVEVSAGGHHTCALSESKRIRCWGDDSFGQSHAPPGPERAGSERYAAVSAGQWHTCAIRESGALTCWGARVRRDASVPSSQFRVDFGQAAPPSGTFRQVSAGATHTCGLRDSGEISCWGSEMTAPAGRYTWITAGGGLGLINPDSGHTCAVRSADPGQRRLEHVVCWGDNSYGQTDVLE